MNYREIRTEELSRALFADFTRHQAVNLCRRRRGGKWVIEPDPFTDDWSEADYAELIFCLKRTLQTGGRVCGAFDESGALKGFASVEGTFIGEKRNFADLSCLHVSEELRGRGIGRKLFGLCAEAARQLGAEKLYISSHSAIETQRFYAAMGCVDATEPNAEHAAREPFDCQLEYAL